MAKVQGQPMILVPVTVSPPEKFNFLSPHLWPQWIKRFERYMSISGNDTKSDSEKVNLLIYIMGEESEEILLQFPTPVVAPRTYADILKCFQDHFIPPHTTTLRTNVIFERFKFNSRIQQQGEPIKAFIANLHSLAESCEYGELKEELIRDRILAGMSDTRTSKLLQFQANLTLDNCILAAKRSEIQANHIKELRSKISAYKMETEDKRAVTSSQTDQQMENVDKYKMKTKDKSAVTSPSQTDQQGKNTDKYKIKTEDKTAVTSPSQIDQQRKSADKYKIKTEDKSAVTSPSQIDQQRKNADKYKIKTEDKSAVISPSQTNQQRENADKHNQCHFCGLQSHSRGKCPAKKSLCKKCKKPGHWASVCSQNSLSSSNKKSFHGSGYVNGEKQTKSSAATEPKTCAKCKEQIKGGVLTALGKTWHPDHFCCNECKNPITESKFHTKDDMPYCTPCHVKLFAPMCHACDEPILDKCVQAMGVNWHEDHFVCEDCKAKLIGQQFMDVAGTPRCQKCYVAKHADKCKGCGKPIPDKAIVALDAKWHQMCFRCSKCSKPIMKDQSFQVENGKPHCVKC